MTVTDGFSHRHYIRDDTLGFKSPKMSADASESDLDLIRDTNPPGQPSSPINLLKIPGRIDDLSAAAHHGFGDESGDIFPLPPDAFDGFLDRGGIFSAGFRVAIFKGAPIAVRGWNLVDMRRGSLPARPIELVRTDLDE